VSPAVGLAEEDVPEFTTFPNPASTEVRFNFGGMTIIPNYIEVYTVDGKQILLQRVSSATPSVEISGLANGKYLVRILNNEKLIGRSRFEVLR
jgi:hypothetical protein